MCIQGTVPYLRYSSWGLPRLPYDKVSVALLVFNELGTWEHMYMLVLIYQTDNG